MDTKPDEKPIQLLKNIVELLSAIGAAVGFFYVVGLLLLAGQIWFTYRLSFETTWYAATLIPQAIALTQGLRVGWLEWVMMLLLFLTAVFPKPKYVERGSEYSKGNNEDSSIIWVGNGGMKKIHLTGIISFFSSRYFQGDIRAMDSPKQWEI